MAAVSAPYGLIPVKRIGNTYDAHGDSLYRIQSGSATAIFNGAPVRLDASGYIVNASAANMGGASPDKYIGVFIGCQFTNPTTLQPQWMNYYPGGVAASDIQAFVLDDAGVVFQIQALAAGFDALAAMGTSYAMNIPGTPGNTLTGKSAISLNTAGGTAATNPWKVVGIATTPDNANATGYVDVLVRVNAGFHVFDRAL